MSPRVLNKSFLRRLPFKTSVFGGNAWAHRSLAAGTQVCGSRVLRCSGVPAVAPPSGGGVDLLVKAAILVVAAHLFEWKRGLLIMDY